VLAGRFFNVDARQMNQASAMTDGNNAARYASKKILIIGESPSLFPTGDSCRDDGMLEGRL
jgi:hypothetical protein